MYNVQSTNLQVPFDFDLDDYTIDLLLIAAAILLVCWFDAAELKVCWVFKKWTYQKEF